MATKAKPQRIVVPSLARMLRDIETPEGFNRVVRTEPKTHWGPAYKVLVFTNEDETIKIEIDFMSVHRESYMLANGHVSFKTPDGGTRTFDRYGVEDSFYIDNPLKVGDRLWQGDRVKHNGGFGTITDTKYDGVGKDRKCTYRIEWEDSRSGTAVYSERQIKSHGIVKHIDVIWSVNQTIKKYIEVKIPEALARIARSENVPSIPFSVTPERKSEVIQTLIGRKTYTFTPSGFGIGYQITWKKCPYGGHRADPDLETFFKLKPLFVNQIDCD